MAEVTRRENSEKERNKGSFLPFLLLWLCGDTKVIIATRMTTVNNKPLNLPPPTMAGTLARKREREPKEMAPAIGTLFTYRGEH